MTELLTGLLLRFALHFVLGMLGGFLVARLAYQRGRHDSMREALAMYDRTIGAKGCPCVHELALGEELRSTIH